jgi:hypothetical protein
MISYGKVQQLFHGDGEETALSIDYNGCQKIVQFGGKYAELARRGLLFNYSVKTAAAHLLAATTGNAPAIWNPAGSGKVLYIAKLATNWLSGTTVVSSLQFNIVRNAGSGISATAPVCTWTNQAPEPAIAGAPFASSMLFAPAVSTFVSAPTFFASTGINLGAVAPTVGTGDYDRDFDGCIALMPGNVITLNACVTSTTALFFTTIFGYELPLADGK